LIEYFCLQDSKSISGFIAYALCAADEALRDANWLPSEDDKKERTVRIASGGKYFPFCAFLAAGPDLRSYQGVSIGGGIGSISDILDASQMITENVRTQGPCSLFYF
jgi:3-oxoacyl-[acyl-carrier-protein] synthase II